VFGADSLGAAVAQAIQIVASARSVIGLCQMKRRTARSLPTLAEDFDERLDDWPSEASLHVVIRLAWVADDVYAVRVLRAMIAVVPTGVANVDATDEPDCAVHDDEFLMVTAADRRVRVPLKVNTSTGRGEFLGLVRFPAPWRRPR